MSDHRNLGYAATTVRPPTEFYGWIPIFSVNGADASQQIQTTDADWKIKGQVGKSEVLTPFNVSEYDFKTDYLWSFSVLRDSGPLRIKAALSGFKISTEPTPLAPLHAGLEQIAAGTAGALPAISAEATALRQELSFSGSQVHYLTLGTSYDDGRWLIQGEIGRSETDTTIVPSSWMAYVQVGRRIGNFTPYAMVSASRPTEDPLRPTNDWNAIGQGTTQDTAYATVNATRTDQTTTALGLRWDFVEQAALKVQWDHVHIDANGYGMWFRSPAINTFSSNVDLFSINVDFIF